MSEGCIVMHHTTPERTLFDTPGGGTRRVERVGKDAIRSSVSNSLSNSHRGTLLIHQETQPQVNLSPGLVTDNEASDLGHVSSLEDGLSNLQQGSSTVRSGRPKRESEDDDPSGSTSTADSPSVPQHELNLTLVEHKQKGMLLDRLTEASKRGRLTLVRSMLYFTCFCRFVYLVATC
jgi:hypothetical protein